MPKKVTEKNSKGTPKKKKTVSAKAKTKSNESLKSPKKVETKVSQKKTSEKNVEAETIKVVETTKPIEKNNKKGKFKRLINELSENTPFVITLCAVIILLAALIFTLCTKRVPKLSNGDEIVASIKGKKITANDLYDELKQSNGTNSLVNLIDSYIANKYVDKITDDDKEYVKQVVDYYKSLAESYNTDLATFLSNYVGLTGIETDDEFYDFVLEDYKKTLAVQKYISDNASEDDLKDYYEKNFSDYLTVKHILIEVDTDAEDADAADKEAYDKAVSLIDIIKNTDKDELDKEFEKLAEENSDDTTTYSKGGLIEDFTISDVVSEFYEASKDLKDGEYTTEPVKTSYGYHIILKVSSKPVEKYKDIKDKVKSQYAQSLLQNDSTLQVSKWDELRKYYKLSINDDFIKENYEKIIKESSKGEN